MELLQLKYFLALAEQQHLTRVAEKLYVSPSAISSSIARLESELGVKLFNRVGRNIELNECGKTYLPYVKHALDELNDGKRHIEDLKEQRNDHLNLVMANPYLWQNIIDGFSRLHPEITLSNAAFDPISNGNNCPGPDVDLIIASPDSFHDMAWDYTLLFEDLVALVVPPDHPFAHRKSISLAEAKDEWFVNVSDSTFAKFTLELCQKAGFTPKCRVICDYMLRPSIAYKERMLAITTYHCRKAGLFSDMVLIPISDPKAVRPQAVFYRKGRYLSAPAKCLKEYLVHQYQDYDPFAY